MVEQISIMLHDFEVVLVMEMLLWQGEGVAELMLNHASINECRDISSFKQELGDIVTNFRQQTIKLGRVSHANVNLQLIV